MKKKHFYPHYNHGGGGIIVPEKSVLLPLFSGKVNVDCTCKDIALMPLRVPAVMHLCSADELISITRDAHALGYSSQGAKDMSTLTRTAHVNGGTKTN